MKKPTKKQLLKDIEILTKQGLQFEKLTLKIKYRKYFKEKEIKNNTLNQALKILK